MHRTVQVAQVHHVDSASASAQAADCASVGICQARQTCPLVKAAASRSTAQFQPPDAMKHDALIS